MGSAVEQIKERLSIAEVIGSYVKLEKSGVNFKARCPFHNEKTPSFFVSTDRGSFYCFGCGEKGDIFSFVEKFEGLDFVGALKVLALRAGVELTRENKTAQTEKDRLYKVLESATQFYVSQLSKNVSAISYIKKRGASDETIAVWRLGFSPSGWRDLFEHLKKLSYTSDEMMKAGLVKKSEKSPRHEGEGFYDTFRGRIMFPICDSSDRVIGFSGRILPELDDGKTGKYINSPETPLYNKSRVLYGLNRAKYDIRKRDYSIMVEGQMDLIMSHQAGFTNTVAVSGTALSSDTVTGDGVTNLGLLTRLSKNVILAFDSDEAGFKASGRNAKIALSLGMDVKVAKMPTGDDPADIILRDSEVWKQIIKNGKHIIVFLLETLREKQDDERKLGKQVEIIVLPYVRALRSAIEQSHFITLISKETGIKEDALWTELKKIPESAESVPTTPAGVVSEKPSPKLERRSAIERKLFGIFFWQSEMKRTDVNVSRMRDAMRLATGDGVFTEREAHYDQIKNELMFEAEIAYKDSAHLVRELAELLLNYEEECIDEKIKVLSREDLVAFQTLLKRKQDIGRVRQNLDKSSF